MNGLRTSTVIVLSIITTLLFLTANFGLWVNKSILDREKFTRELTTVIQSEEVTDSIADETLNQLLENNPFLRQLADSTIKPALSGLLGSPRLEPAINKLAEEIHISLTSPEPREISINISESLEFIKGVLNTISPDRTAPTDIPDKIVLAEEGEIPSIYSQSIFLVWAGSIGAIIGIGLLIYMILVAKEQNKGTVLKIFGASLTVGTILTLISISNFTPTIAASIEKSNSQVIVVNLYETLTQDLEIQTTTLLAIGIVFVIAGFLYQPIQGRYRKFVESRKKG